MEILENFKVTLEFQTSVDTETGEISTKCIKKSIDKLVNAIEDKPKRKRTSRIKEESSSPQLILEDNKYYLNSAAITLMCISPDDRLDIKYEKDGTPVIGTDNIFGTHSGNKLSKSNTVVCRGSKREELSKYGTIFNIVPHATKEGLFMLIGDTTSVSSNGDENIAINESDEDLSFNEEDFLDLIEDKDATITEVNSSIFNL